VAGGALGTGSGRKACPCWLAWGAYQGTGPRGRTVGRGTPSLKTGSQVAPRPETQMTGTSLPPGAVPAGFESQYETIEGVRLHYVAGGRTEAPVVVLLAGFPESWFAWREVLPLLARDFRVVVADLPGQGDSDKPLSGYDTGSVGDAVHALVTRLGIDQYALVGHDIGAWVAFAQASRHAAAVRRLVLLDAGIPGVTLPDATPLAPDKSWRTWHFAFHMLPDLPETLITGREREYLDWFLRRKTANPMTFTDADLEEYRRILTAPGGLRASLAYYRALPLSAEQNKAALAKGGPLPMPLLAVSADQGSIPDMAAPLRAHAADVRGVVIARSGHFIPEEQPAALARELIAFLTGQ
jgi:pimeloyl-ACP methyl ester carboxylesterase